MLFRFPTQLEDAYAVVEWVSENASLLNIDPTRIAVGGDSAGGSLAAAMAIVTRDRNGPHLCHQLLVYPCMTSPLTDDIPSHVTYRDGPVVCCLARTPHALSLPYSLMGLLSHHS